MKFYITILTAIVLLGLCVLEKKAKENMTIKVIEENSQKTFLAETDFRENEKGSDSQRRASQNLNLLTMASADSSSKSLFSGKALLNFSIGELFTAQP